MRAVHFAAAGDDAAAATAAREAQPTRRAGRRTRRSSCSRRGTRSPPTRAVSVDAAEALSLVGRYEEALAALPAGASDPSTCGRAALVTARAAWALDRHPDRAATRSTRCSRDPDAERGPRSEMLAIRSRIRARIDWDLEGAMDDGLEALDAGGRRHPPRRRRRTARSAWRA